MNSLDAIKEYIDVNPSKEDRHEAFVHFTDEYMRRYGQNKTEKYPEVFDVKVYIVNGTGYVELGKRNNENMQYPCFYNSNNDVFTFIYGRTLEITSENKFKQRITVDITPVKVG